MSVAGAGSRQGAGAATGYRLMEDAAGVLVEAWGPNREVTLRQVVLGMVASFAETAGTGVQAAFPLFIGALNDEDALAYVIQEVIHSVRVRQLVPVDVLVERGHRVGPCVVLRVAPLDSGVRIIGAPPVAISRHGLHLAPEPDGTWRARATLELGPVARG